jgi:hypothetical protein
MSPGEIAVTACRDSRGAGLLRRHQLLPGTTSKDTMRAVVKAGAVVAALAITGAAAWSLGPAALNQLGDDAGAVAAGRFPAPATATPSASPTDVPPLPPGTTGPSGIPSPGRGPVPAADRPGVTPAPGSPSAPVQPGSPTVEPPPPGEPPPPDNPPPSNPPPSNPPPPTPPSTQPVPPPMDPPPLPAPEGCTAGDPVGSIICAVLDLL